MQSGSKVCLVIITYNNPALLVPQLQYIRRFCTDDFEIVIVDNSTEPEAIEAIKYHSEGCRYIKTNASSKGGSGSHAFAANLSYLKVKDEYDLFFYADHDLFPVKPFSVSEILGDKMIAGLGQQKSKTYFWPGCVMFRRMDEIDFSCNGKHGLDTGGNLYKIIEKHGLDNCRFLGEEFFENPYFVCNNPKYNHYSVIEGTFLHMVGGSDWEGVERNEERINSLLNVLKERIESSGNFLP